MEVDAFIIDDDLRLIFQGFACWLRNFALPKIDDERIAVPKFVFDRLLHNDRDALPRVIQEINQRSERKIVLLTHQDLNEPHFDTGARFLSLEDAFRIYYALIISLALEEGPKEAS